MASTNASLISFEHMAGMPSNKLKLIIGDETCIDSSSPAQGAPMASSKLEAYFILEGEGMLTLNNEDALLAARDTVLIAPGVLHRLSRNCSSFRYQHASAAFDRSNTFLQAAFPRIVKLGMNKERFALIRNYCSPDVRNFIVRVKKELARCDYEHSMTARGMVFDLFAGMEHELEPIGTGMPTIEEVINHISRNFSHATLQSTSGHFFCHPNSIAKLLKREVGLTFSEVLSDIRMARAQALLRNANLSVQCVANACGYKNMTHFYRTFSNRFSITPGEYRRRHANAHR